MTRPPENLPDPWLFDSEALLTQLDRIREIVMNIPISDLQSTHFGINRAVTALWDLQQHLRYLLHLHREGQRQIVRTHGNTKNPTSSKTVSVVPAHDWQNSLWNFWVTFCVSRSF